MQRPRNPFTRFLLRIDNINRILVLVSRAFFLSLPSYILFYLQDGYEWKTIVIPCLRRLGATIGVGILCVYRPRRMTFAYFFERALILLSMFLSQAPFGRQLSLSVHPIVILFLVYCLLARLVNLLFLAYYFRKRSFFGKNSRKEGTNGDGPFDFLNAVPTNKNIENDLNSIPEGKRGIILKERKQIKLSKVRRTIAFFLAIVRFILSFIQSGNPHSLPSQVSLVGILSLPLFYGGSLLFPRHFKYGFYFNGRRFLLCDYLSFDFHGKIGSFHFFFLAARILFGITFLVSLIVEGRIWTGSKEDD